MSFFLPDPLSPPVSPQITMLGLLLSAVLSCIIQIHVANCESPEGNETSPDTPTPAEMLTSTTVQPIATMSQSSLTSAHSTPPPSGKQPTCWELLDERCLPVFLLVGGLIVACTVLIVSTLVLAWKVCLLSQRVGALSRRTEPIGQAGCERGPTGKKSRLSETELRESTRVADHLLGARGGTEEEGEDRDVTQDKAEEAKEADHSTRPAPPQEPSKADPTSEGTEKPEAEV